MKPWWKQNLDLWQERLTDQELELVRTFVHVLSDEELARREKIMRREMDRMLFWGFFGSVPLQNLRQKVYMKLVRPIVRKQR